MKKITQKDIDKFKKDIDKLKEEKQYRKNLYLSIYDFNGISYEQFKNKMEKLKKDYKCKDNQITFEIDTFESDFVTVIKRDYTDKEARQILIQIEENKEADRLRSEQRKKEQELKERQEYLRLKKKFEGGK